MLFRKSAPLHNLPAPKKAIELDRCFYLSNKTGAIITMIITTMIRVNRSFAAINSRRAIPSAQCARLVESDEFDARRHTERSSAPGSSRDRGDPSGRPLPAKRPPRYINEEFIPGRASAAQTKGVNFLPAAVEAVAAHRERESCIRRFSRNGGGGAGTNARRAADYC